MDRLFNERHRADSFGDNAAEYDRVRPPYPTVMIDLLMEESPRSALDVGCGTAIAARLLMARGMHVVGLEPDPRMAAIARDHGVVVEEDTFERWDRAGRTFDLLTAGQAWHWVDPEAGAAKAAHVLRPGGRIGLFWNQPQPEGSTRQVMQAAYAEHAPELGRQSVLLGQRSVALYDGIADALRRTGQFDDIEMVHFGHHVTYTTDHWLSLAATHSDHHALPSEQLAGLLAALKRGLDALGGQFAMRYETLLITGRTVRSAVG